MSYDHKRLLSLSRELFLEHEWQMPAGLAERSLSDPRTCSLAEYQQAKRLGQDPKAVKTAFQDAWAISDSKAAFAHALEERGYRIARGDRRGFVAVDFQGEVFSIPKWAGIRTRQVRARLGDESDLPGVEEVKSQIAANMLSQLDHFAGQLRARDQKRQSAFEHRRRTLVARQRAERQALKEKIAHRRLTETKERQGRFRTGLSGLWDFLRGENRRLRKEIEREAKAGLVRDRAEMDGLVSRHLGQRQTLDVFRVKVDDRHTEKSQQIEQDRQLYQDLCKRVDNPSRPPKRRRRRQRTQEP